MVIEQGSISEKDKRILNAGIENKLIECYQDAMD